MNVELVAMIVLGVSFAAVCGLYLLPSKKSVRRSLQVPANPSELFKLLRSSEGFQTFNPYKDADPNLAIELYGPKSGVGSAFRFEGKDGKGSQTIIALESDASVTMEIDMGPIGKPIQQISLREVGDQTEVQWEVSMDFGKNPMKRIFGIFMDGMMGKTFERGLQNIARVSAS